MTRKEIRAERRRLNRESELAEKEFRKAMQVIDMQTRELQAACPHPPEAAGSGSYSRWCLDCGWSEDFS